MSFEQEIYNIHTKLAASKKILDDSNLIESSGLMRVERARIKSFQENLERQYETLRKLFEEHQVVLSNKTLSPTQEILVKEKHEFFLESAKSFREAAIAYSSYITFLKVIRKDRQQILTTFKDLYDNGTKDLYNIEFISKQEKIELFYKELMAFVRIHVLKNTNIDELQSGKEVLKSFERLLKHKLDTELELLLGYVDEASISILAHDFCLKNLVNNTIETHLATEALKDATKTVIELSDIYDFIPNYLWRTRVTVEATKETISIDDLRLRQADVYYKKGLKYGLEDNELMSLFVTAFTKELNNPYLNKDSEQDRKEILLAALDLSYQYKDLFNRVAPQSMITVGKEAAYRVNQYLEDYLSTLGPNFSKRELIVHAVNTGHVNRLINLVPSIEFKPEYKVTEKLNVASALNLRDRNVTLYGDVQSVKEFRLKQKELKQAESLLKDMVSSHEASQKGISEIQQTLHEKLDYVNGDIRRIETTSKTLNKDLAKPRSRSINLEGDVPQKELGGGKKFLLAIKATVVGIFTFNSPKKLFQQYKEDALGIKKTPTITKVPVLVKDDLNKDLAETIAEINNKCTIIDATTKKVIGKHTAIVVEPSISPSGNALQV